MHHFEYQGENKMDGRKEGKILSCIYTLTCGFTQHMNAYTFNSFLAVEINTNELATKLGIKLPYE